jgi:hypothetical protein
MQNRISPLNLSGLRLTVERECANPQNEGKDEQRRRKRDRVEEVVYYMCTKCEEEHDDRRDAEDCCPDVDPGAVLKDHCPVCQREHLDVESAADCCLWKDLDAPSRWRIAALVEAGKTWTESIEEVTGQKLNQLN